MQIMATYSWPNLVIYFLFLTCLNNSKHSFARCTHNQYARCQQQQQKAIWSCTKCFIIGSDNKYRGRVPFVSNWEIAEMVIRMKTKGKTNNQTSKSQFHKTNWNYVRFLYIYKKKTKRDENTQNVNVKRSYADRAQGQICIFFLLFI